MMDYIIVGAGGAGLYSALKLPTDKKITILCKEDILECNTSYAQGGIATAIDESDIDSHVEDTMIAGANLSDKEAVKVLSTNSISIIKDFIDMGFEFDKDDSGNLLYTKEAAHSRKRILHADGDATGKMMMEFLSTEVKKRDNITIIENATVIDLLIENDICYGVEYFKDDQFKTVTANNTFLASGGVGSLYQYHTNSHTISADIHGICIEKGIKLNDMQMLQFHPTVFTHNKWARKALLTEALRGEGAYVVDEDNNRFLFEYDKRGELAPRSIVSQAIFDYNMKTKKRVFLSVSHFDKKFMQKRFPNIYKNFKSMGYDLPSEKIPISPAFHYCMGGVETNLDAKVKGFSNLYAIGEIASTGVHGGNRLASNSLLEAFVFANIASINSLSNDSVLGNFKPKEYKLIKSKDKKRKEKLRKIMWKHVGIIRRDKKLKKALRKVNKMLDKDIGRLLYLRLLTAKTIIESAIEGDSIGANYKL
jgi:L-aspartate oxidase